VAKAVGYWIIAKGNYMQKLNKEIARDMLLQAKDSNR